MLSQAPQRSTANGTFAKAWTDLRAPRPPRFAKLPGRAAMPGAAVRELRHENWFLGFTRVFADALDPVKDSAFAFNAVGALRCPCRLQCRLRFTLSCLPKHRDQAVCFTGFRPLPGLILTRWPFFNNA